MTEKKKGFSKKEKIVGAIASTAIMAVPFMVAPAQQGYATLSSSNPPTAVEKITTIVIPLNGTKYIDLDALYSAKYMQVGQNQTELNIAEGKFTLENRGIYKITASSVGTATFTVTGTRYEPSYTQITDTFQVIVVPNTVNPDEFKFDILNVVNVMKEFPNQFQSREEVTGLLRNVNPKTVSNGDPFDYDSYNVAPVQTENTERFHGVVGQIIQSWEIEGNIYQYFFDGNENQMGVIYVDKNNENIQIEEKYEGESFIGYELTPLVAGDFDLDVLVVDHHGGLTRGVIPFHIAAAVNHPPQLKTDSVLAKHFNFNALQNPVLFLSNNAEIDLNEIFFDVEEDSIHYEIVVDVAYGSASTTTNTIELGSASTVSWESLNALFQSSIIRIKEIHAFDSEHPDTPFELAVDIEHRSNEPFPAVLDMYQSNAAGTSSYILDYRSAVGFADNYAGIEPTEIHNSAANAVTASVYQNVYLKFDAKDFTTSSLSKIKIYAHNNQGPNHPNQSILYQDDFNFKVISPEDTRNPETDRAAISPITLYPYHDNNYWAGSFNFYNFVSVIPELYNNSSSWTFETGDTMTMRLTSSKPTGTSVIFKIDPDNGSRVFYVPYIQPDGVYVQP